MTSVVAIGETHELEGFAPAGVTVIATADDEDVERAWRELEPDVGLVILSVNAALVLDSELDDRPDVLTAVMP